MTKAEYFKLLKKYEDGLASDQEVQLLHAYYNLFEVREDGLEALDEKQQAALQQQIRAGIQHRAFDRPGRRWNVSRIRIASAAAAVIALMIGGWLYYRSSLPQHTPDKAILAYTNDVAPGKNKATLTVSDGGTVELSDTKTGVVIDNSLKYNDGTDIDNVASPARSIRTLTVTTPRGGQYQVVLPDGTKIWLNAASKISFPSRFSGKERRIMIDGEAYLEVATAYLSVKGQKAKQPFIVESRGQAVEVLGTRFNINCYADERSAKTTLLEGAIRLSAANKNIILHPGEQAINTVGALQVQAVDASLAIDWKNQEFIFKREPLSSLMRRVARWYDIDVVFTSGVDQQQTFSGQVSRTKSVSELLNSLAATGLLKFTIDGKKVTIMDQAGK